MKKLRLLSMPFLLFGVFFLSSYFLLSTEGLAQDNFSTEINIVDEIAGTPVAETKSVDGRIARFAANELLVTLDPDKIEIADKSLLDEVSLKILDLKNNITSTDEIWDQNVIVYKVENGQNLFEVKSSLEKSSLVKSVMLNYQFRPFAINSNDPQRSDLWGLDNTGQSVNGTVGTTDADMDIPEAFAVSEGSSDIIVAIIDTGTDYTHPELQNMMWNGASCVDYNNQALGNCTHGYDFESNDKVPLPDESSHGTHVAGTIAAEKNNGVGLLGVAPHAKVMALKSAFFVSELIMAINFAEHNNAKVINASWGFGSTAVCDDSYFSSLYQAISDFSGLFIAAAGNEGVNIDTNYIAPAGYSITRSCWTGLSNIITVGASDQDDNIASFSNYGPNTVTVAAPGTNIYSTVADATLNFEVLVDADDSTVTPPGIPTGWTESGGDANTWGSYLWGTDEYIVTNTDFTLPDNMSNAFLTSSTINLSGSSGDRVSLRFSAVCDTDLTLPNSGGDHVELLFSDDGSNFDSIDKFNEQSMIADLAGYDSNYAYQYLVYDVPESYLNSNFKFRFNLVTNGTDNSHYGCFFRGFTVNTYGSTPTYSFYQGTSMATPHVAGLATYLWSYNNALSTTDIKTAITANSDSKSSLNSYVTSGHRVNAYGALQSIYTSAPVLAEVTPVTTPTNDNTPDYTFSSDSTGTITYGGSCSSATTAAVVGNNTITFNTLADATYSNCTISVTNGGTSDPLAVSSFRVDTQEPTVTITSSSGSSGSRTNTNPIPLTITFNENVAGFTEGEIGITGATLSDFTPVSGTIYTANATPSAEGPVTVDVNADVASDSANNLNTAATQFVITYDFTGPTIAEVTPVTTPTTDTTPEYTFSSDEAGTIVYGGSCSSGTTSAITGNNTISFNSLPAGTYSDCTIRVNDEATNQSNLLNVTSFEVTANAPVLTEVTPVTTPANDTTPEYVFNTDTNGDLSYGGSCSSLTASAVVGNNTITFEALVDGVYSDCTITLRDSFSNDSNVLAVSSFTIDTAPPDVVIGSPAGANGFTTGSSPVNFTFVFDQDVSGFESGDISVLHGTLGNFNSVDASSYTAKIIPTTEGSVTIDIPQGVTQDLAGNLNNAATQFIFYYDLSDANPTEPDPETEIEIKKESPVASSGKLKYGSKIELSSNSDAVSYFEYKWDKDKNWKRYKSKLTSKPGKHTLYVKAYDGSGEVISETDYEVKTESEKPIYDLRVEKIDQDTKTIELKWHSRSSNISKFMVYREDQNDLSSLLNINLKSDLDFADSPTVSKKGEKLEYRIVAYDEEGKNFAEEKIEVDVPWSAPAKTYAKTVGQNVKTIASVKSYVGSDYSGISTTSSKKLASSNSVNIASNDYYGIVTNESNVIASNPDGYQVVLGAEDERVIENLPKIEQDYFLEEELSLWEKIKNKIQTIKSKLL